MSATYFVRLHGDHGFTPASRTGRTLEEARSIAEEALRNNSYFRGATVHHARVEVARITRT